MEYTIITPPFQVKKFEDMSKKEAQANFDWFCNEIPNRVDLLRNYYKATGGVGEIDFEPESLIPLWNWFLQHIEVNSKSNKQIQEEKQRLPDSFRDIIEIETQQLSVKAQMLLVDIAIYFGEVFVKKHNLKWGFVTKPKQLISLNKPVVLGFGLKHLEPTLIVHNLVRKVLREEAKQNALFEIYTVWVQFIK